MPAYRYIAVLFRSIATFILLDPIVFYLMQVKIMRSKDRINSQGIGRSMGYGFVEFTTHEAALSVVRSVSNNPSVLGPHRVCG